MNASSTTTNTQGDTRPNARVIRATAAEKIERLAALAVAQHAVDYDLPYSGIDTPIRPGDPITVKVRAIHLDAWLDTLVVDAEPRTKPLAETREYETVTYRAHLHSAIGDVPVKVFSILYPVGAAS